MGMYGINDIVIGTTLSREEYQDRFGDPYYMQERDNNLVAIDGAEKQWGRVVLGLLIERIDGQYGVEARKPRNLLQVYESKRKEVLEELSDLGLEDHRVSVYLVGSFM